MGWLYSDQWAAGFFDGEGCVQIGKRTRGRFVQHVLWVQVSQRDRMPLEVLKNHWGGSIKGNGVAAWQWVVICAQAEQFLRAIRPHALVKAAVIDVALDFRMTFVGPGQRLPSSVVGIREGHRAEVKRLNRGA